MTRKADAAPYDAEHSPTAPLGALPARKGGVGRFFPKTYRINDSDSDTDSSNSDCSELLYPHKSRLLSNVSEPIRPLPCLRGPMISLYSVRHSLTNSRWREVYYLTKDLLKLTDSKVKEPFRFILARHIACLRERIDSLPTRKGRRNLNSDAARHIVGLKSPKFTAILDELSRRWGQTIPHAMVNEEPTHSLLLALEDAMFSKYDPWTKVTLDWGGDKESVQSKHLPLPIIGLDYTLRLYFPTSAIDLSSVTDLDLSSRNLTEIPPWVRKMEHLQHLWIDETPIAKWPPWLRTLTNLEPTSAFNNSVRRPRTDGISQPAIPRLADLAVAKIRQFVDDGGDWTDLLELPSHLLDKIIKFSKPIQTHEPVASYVALEIRW